MVLAIVGPAGQAVCYGACESFMAGMSESSKSFSRIL